MVLYLPTQGRRNGFGIGGGGGGGGQKKICAKFFYITLTYKKDTILFISISVISKINRAISLFYPYLYTLIYMLLFLNSSFFWLAKYWGGGGQLPPLPPPVPTAMLLHCCQH